MSRRILNDDLFFIGFCAVGVGAVWFFSPLIFIGSVELLGILMSGVTAVIFVVRHIKRERAFRSLLKHEEHTD